MGRKKADTAGTTVENTPVKNPAETVKPPETAVVSADRGVNLRSGPAKLFSVHEVLPAGARVVILSLPTGAEVKGWTVVRAESGAVGWVDVRFLAED